MFVELGPGLTRPNPCQSLEIRPAVLNITRKATPTAKKLVREPFSNSQPALISHRQAGEN